LWAQEALPSSDTDPASLRAAAEAIDPLAEAARSEAAWRAFLTALEADDGPVADQALALNRIGDARYYQQDFEAALDSSLEAKRRLEEAGETAGEAMAETLSNVATFYGATGQTELDLPLQERSLAIRRNLYGDDPLVLPPEQAKVLGLGYLNYANSLFVRGRLDEAADLVKPSIDGLITGQLTDATLFVAMTSGANMLSDAERRVEALDLAQRGVAKAGELLPEGHPFMGFAQGTLARVLLDSGRYEEAEAPARRALDIMANQLGPDHPSTLAALSNLSVILARLGRYEESLALAEVLVGAARGSDPEREMIALANRSNMAFEANDNALALAMAQLAAERASSLAADNRRAIRGMTVLAHRQEEAGQYDEARASIEAVANRRQELGDFAPDALLDIQRGVLAIKTGQRDAGWDLVERGNRQLESDLITAAGSYEVGADLSSFYDPILQVVEAAFLTGRPDAALKSFEMASWGANARARQLATLRSHVDDDPGLAERIDRVKKGRERLRLLNRERAALLASDQSELATQRAMEIEALTSQVEQLDRQLAIDIPDYGTWLRPQAPSISDMQARLSPDEAVLIVMPGRTGTFTMAITSADVVMEKSSGGRPQVRSLVADLQAALDPHADEAQDFPVRQAAALHDIVLPGRAAAALEGRSRVKVVTADALSRLPFGLLLHGGTKTDQTDYKSMDWLVRRHAFSIALTPASAIAVDETPARSAGFLGIGAPALRGDEAQAIDLGTVYRGGSVAAADILALPRLPATEAEIAAVAAAFEASNSTVLTGPAATEARVRRAAEGASGVVLFATHGLLGGELGGLREPALVLTPGERSDLASDDGLLQASEITDLAIDADFVILSACNSAAGRNETAPVYTGLANAFLGSGTKAMMLSHWQVRDDAAAFLTVATIKDARAGLPRAEALRKAQLSLINGGSDIPQASHPAVWAPFVIVE